ncbi:MAG: hypothetical protein KJO98_03130 [Rhodothermia bacterium]|nr:hypothetical protein [Rhodothermia bacterium]
MASLEMHVSYPLDAAVVSRLVSANSPGNYALGRLTEDQSTFLISFVGRADNDLRKPLLFWAGEGSFTHFKFSYASSVRAAFEKECANYHDFGGSEKLQNTNHPARPAGKRWQCPRCRVFDTTITVDKRPEPTAKNEELKSRR